MNNLTNIPIDTLNSNGTIEGYIQESDIYDSSITTEVGSHVSGHVITDGCYNMNRDVNIRGIDTKITIQYSPFEIIFYTKDERTGKLFVNEDGYLSADGNIEKSALDFFQIVFEEIILRNL